MFIVMRVLLVIVASASGYLIIHQIGSNKLAYAGLISGLLIAVSAMVFEERVKKTPLRIVLGGAFGLIVGLVVANLITYPLTVHFGIDRYLELASYLFTNSIIGYLGLSIGMKKGDDFEGRSFAALFSDKGAAEQKAAPRRIILDTSVIIDGRIAEVAETGFIDGAFVVPQFVLQELQHIADSSDNVKRVRGRRGLDMLKCLQGCKNVTVEITDRDFQHIKEVDAKLVALARELGAKVLTNDGNLNKIAELQGVTVISIHRLAASLKPAVLPGEIMNILVLKEGKEFNQGVGYLDDGTMVVIDNAKDYLGKSVDVSITSVLQTTGGRMIFSKVKDEVRKPVYQ